MIPPSTTITDEGRRTRRILLWVAVGIVALNLVLWVVSRFASEGGVTGPVGSSFVTTRSGLAGLEGTLRRLGFATDRLRVPLDEVALDPDGTLVISDVGATEFTTPELNRMDRFLRDGGRVLVAGAAGMVDRLLEDPPDWQASGAERAEFVGGLLGDVPDAPVPLSGFGSLDTRDEDRPFLLAGDATVVGAWRPVGEGTFVWLADSHPLHNVALAESAVASVGLVDPLGPVYFDEFRHGYTRSGGVWAVIPDPWQTTLILGGLAALISLVGYGRRFGPPYDTERRLPPGREEYLEAVAGIMARSGDHREALRLIRQEARQRLAERTAGETTPEAAREAGLGAEEAEAILQEDDSEETLVAADRALATLIREKRR